MKTIFLAALAALAPFVPHPAHAAPDTAAVTAADVVLHTHIRTTLHGSVGPVVVLIPGMSTPGAVWDAQVARLAPDHRVLVVEVRGFDGERGTANEGVGAIDGVVADIAADLTARGLGDATIAGHSLGGLIAMKLGLAHPELARALLIVDALPFFGTVFAPDMTVEKARPQAERMRTMITASAEAMRMMGVSGTDSGTGAMGMSIDEATRVRIANWSLDAEPLAVAQFVYEDVLSDLRQDIAALAMPVTVLHTADGPTRDTQVAHYMTDYAALPTARLVPVARSAHFIQLDRPDVFAEELAALLSR